MLLYSLLHLTGYDVPLKELKNFRQLGSITPGHPEFGMTPGVETTTGPLGQGFGTGVGMAMAERFMAKTFNKDDHTIVDHYTYAIVSDGDLMEGISHESASLAGHLKLNKLIYLYDSNKISIDGSTDLAFTDDSKKRFEAYGWHVQQIDGHNHADIEEAIKNAQASDEPSLIECKTTIGFGSPNKAGTAASHGSPLGADEIKLTKNKLNWPYEDSFYIPEEVKKEMSKAVKSGGKLESDWKDSLQEFEKKYPADSVLFKKFISREMPEDWSEVIPEFEADEKGLATRNASGKVLDQMAEYISNLIGGSADLTGSTKTDMKGKGIYQADNYKGRNLHYGVREHGMAAAVNGLALHGGIIPFGATFLIFSDYNKPAIRIAALSKIPSIFVFTHDSIGLGEDGPTHQPIEQLAALRATPNVTVLRPADANETAFCWKAAIENAEGPSLLVLTRQNLPTLDRSAYGKASGTEKGAYILKKESNDDNPDLILMATGSEVNIIVRAAEQLEDKGVSTRVVSIPSWELFEKQNADYKESVFPKSVTNRISVEAASPMGWHKYTGTEGIIMGIDRFGESGPYEEVYEHLGLTVEKVVENGLSLVK